MIRIVALTNTGHCLAKNLKSKMTEISDEQCDVWFKPVPFSKKVQSFFSNGDRLILICATGIAVRTLAPVLRNKNSDPAVLVLDEGGEFVIPLLSGHEGGANDWADKIAKLINSTIVQTTAKSYLKPVYAIGMGCERNCSLEDLNSLLQECLSVSNLSIKQIGSINSIDIKADEKGLLELCRQLEIPYRTWNKECLSEVEDLLSSKSDYIYQVVGVYGVAESAALYAARQEATVKGAAFQSDLQTLELILGKQKNAKATCAIARAYPT